MAMEAQFKPGRLARQCGVSLRTLQRHFNKTYGITATEWLRSVRMKEAYARLTGGHRIKEVAIDLGYRQISHFSRDFKARYGVPPRDLFQPKRLGTAPLRTEFMAPGLADLPPEAHIPAV